MGLFKDFKEDFSQAVNEMMPGADPLEMEDRTDSLMVDTIGEEVDVKTELSKLDGLLEEVKEEKVTPKPEPVQSRPEPAVSVVTPQPSMGTTNRTMSEERRTMSDTVMDTRVNTQVADETTVITASTVLTGSLSSEGSFDIQGTINGNVSCNGKISVTGTINGNSTSSEFFADVAKIEGEISSTGTVKVGAGSVIIGNITAASAVIAGAVKGDIDVQGPVVVDTSAVVMGNIKSRSVQINNGAVIEGFCSQCYADIDVQGLFDGK